MIRKPLRPLARILRARETGQDPDAIEAENRAERHAEIRAGLAARDMKEPGLAEAAPEMGSEPLLTKEVNVAVRPAE